MSLYLKINIASLLIPFIFSFHPKIGYYKMWRYSVPAMVLSAIPYIIWDEIFTQQGVWGFNPQYLSGIYISSLPLEEVLFFICIPYASVFTHFTLTKLLPNLRLKQTITYLISYLIIATLISLAILFSDRAYTMVNAVLNDNSSINCTCIAPPTIKPILFNLCGYNGAIFYRKRPINRQLHYRRNSVVQ